MLEEDGLQEELGAENVGNYVPVAHARDNEQASQLRDILGDHDIPAVIDDEGHGEGVYTSRDIPVLVPGDMAEEACEVIQEYDEMDDVVLDDGDDEFEDDDEDDDLASLATEVDPEDEVVDGQGADDEPSDDTLEDPI